MVPSKQSTFTNHPVFMLRLGARFVFRIHLATGSRRGWVPLMLTGPIKMRIGFARSDEGDTLEVCLSSLHPSCLAKPCWDNGLRVKRGAL